MKSGYPPRPLTANGYILKQIRFIFTLFGIPLICIALLSLILLHILGRADLLRFAFSQLLTWTGARRVAIVVGGLAFVTLLRHSVWYQNEPPPMWFRRSIWLNMVEVLILMVIILAGIWAFSRFAPPSLP